MFVQLPDQWFPPLAAAICVFACAALSASDLVSDALEMEPDRVMEAAPPEEAQRNLHAYASFYTLLSELTRTRDVTDAQLKALFEVLDKTPDSPFLATTLLAELRRPGKADFITEQFFLLARKHPSQFMLNAIASDLLQLRKRIPDAVLLLRNTADFLDRAEDRDTLIRKDPAYAEYVLLKLAILLAMERKYAESEQLLDKIVSWGIFKDNLFPAQLRLINQAALRRDASDRPFLWIFPSDRERAEKKFEETAETYLKKLDAVQAKGESVNLKRHSAALKLLAEEKHPGALSPVIGNLLNNANDLPSLLFLAGQYAQRKEPLSAARVWQQIFRTKEKLPPGFYPAGGDVLAAAGMKKEAIGLYRTALRMAPGNNALKLRLAQLLFTEGKYREVLELLGGLSLPAAQRMAAYCAYLQGNYSEALKHFKALHQRESGSGKGKDSLVFTYADSAEKAGDYALAEQLLRDYLKANPDSAEALNFLGYLFAERGVNLDEAEKLIRRALELDPGNRDYLDSMAWVLYRKKQYAEALKWIQKALKAEPDKPFSATIPDHAGDIHAALGDHENAVRCWKEAVSNYTPEPVDVKKILVKIKNAGGRL